ncbi:MAG TPA: PilZ domain-containing protein [Spirochaetota bacterium]|nr:PilZ domain-containing protein [Spirochaetota bacterium]
MINVPISRIEKEFIFGFLIKNKIRVEIKCMNSTTEGVLLEQNSKEVKIELSLILEELMGYQPEIQVFFYFQNTHHTFNSNVLKMQNNIIIIRNPDSVAKNLQRKFQRVLTDGRFNVHFEIQGDILPMDYPICKKSYYPTQPPISADFSDVKMDGLLKKFKEKMSNIVSINKIVMLRNYTPKTFFESIVLNTGKILYIPNSHADVPTKQYFDNVEILLRQDWIDFEISQNQTSVNTINKSISNYLTMLSKNNMLSYCIIPIIYRNYVVGLIYLMNNHQLNQKIDEKVVNYSQQFSKIITYTLMQSGYFSAEEGKKDKFDIPIFDLSPAGLAFYIENGSLEEKLELDQNFRFFIEIQNRPIRVLAKLVRKFQKLSKFFYGFVFLEIKTEDYEFLNKILYGPDKII